jgi:hypothetical protein
VHDRTLPGAAYGPIEGFPSVHAAIPGAQVAVFQPLPGTGDASLEFARFRELQVSGLHTYL